MLKEKALEKPEKKRSRLNDATIVNSSESATRDLRPESSAATIGEIIEMSDAANMNMLTSIPRNRTLFYEKNTWIL